jgi:hypothetical protein
VGFCENELLTDHRNPGTLQPLLPPGLKWKQNPLVAQAQGPQAGCNITELLVSLGDGAVAEAALAPAPGDGISL